MGTLQTLYRQYKDAAYDDLSQRQVAMLIEELKKIPDTEIISFESSKQFVELLYKVRKNIASNQALFGEGFPQFIRSVLSVGEDGIYSSNLHFLFELIQNVDDCNYEDLGNCALTMHFSFCDNTITLSYNETGFTPFNVFAITGIAVVGKNRTAKKLEIGEKGIGFKSVFGIASKVLIQSGWFSFALEKENFTLPVGAYEDVQYTPGTRMILYNVPAQKIYTEMRSQFCSKAGLFSQNPILFLNKLNRFHITADEGRSIEFVVPRTEPHANKADWVDKAVVLSVDVSDVIDGKRVDSHSEITCMRFVSTASYSAAAYKSRYPASPWSAGEKMQLQVLFPYPECLHSIGQGKLYSFLPTQMKLTVPVAIHVPFKLDASRENVDPEQHNRWFAESCEYLSKLLDASYRSFSKEVGAKLLFYLPYKNESLISPNNGKESCLRSKETFKGAHFSDLPIFQAETGEFLPARSLFSMSSHNGTEEIREVYRLLQFDQTLFIPPEGLSAEKYGITVKRPGEIGRKLYTLALSDPKKAKQAFELLNSFDIDLKREDFTLSSKIIQFHSEQVSALFGNRKILDFYRSVAKEFVSTSGIPPFQVLASSSNIETVIGDGFTVSDAPQKVSQYLERCQKRCVLLDIPEKEYFACGNALVLSKETPVESFAEFCKLFDSSNSFMLNIELSRLYRCVEEMAEDDTVPPAEYLRKLKELRLSVKKSLGLQGYHSYISLILSAGTDNTRFVQELLQNADDCLYPDDVIPSFQFTLNNSVITTAHNECGFTKENVRALTAIGESTKKKLKSGTTVTIGEKGVGFKTIFAAAREVEVHSKEFDFTLTSQDPTIPKLLPSSIGYQGTMMKIKLKPDYSLTAFTPSDILHLCLCLNKLKNLTILNHEIIISDTDDSRTIEIDKKTYSFRKVVHKFLVNDSAAIEERSSASQHITPEQEIICYIPISKEGNNFYIYSGLPTRHKIKIPMVINAPFALTTSREEIITGDNRWNTIIRREMYAAILKSILAYKDKDRISILRFINYIPRRYGNEQRFINDMFDSDFLCNFDFLALVRNEQILPTMNGNAFVSPASGLAVRFPDAVNFLFRGVPVKAHYKSSAIDISSAEYDPVLNALGCKPANTEIVLEILSNYVKDCIHSESFREKLYEYLRTINSELKYRCKKLPIIPVFSTSPGKTEFVSWKDDSIFVKKGVVVSSSDYYVLNERILSKSVCEQIVGENINEMNFEWERNRYNEKLHQFVHGSKITEIYTFLLNEFNSGRLERYKSLGTLLEIKELIPLKNQIGLLTDSDLYIASGEMYHYATPMIQKISVHPECEKLAIYLQYPKIANIHFEDIDYSDMLSADDVEFIQDYLTYSDDILRGFILEGCLSDELIHDYELGYLALSKGIYNGKEYLFPEDPVKNRNALALHIKKRCQNKITLQKKEVSITKLYAVDNHGNGSFLDSSEARNATMRKYTPDGAHRICFCQMCKAQKANEYIEVNNIEATPKYYFPELRVALCLECSKYFESLRASTEKREPFIRALKNAQITAQGKIDVPIGDAKITFTATHLAEIQEILRFIKG